MERLFTKITDMYRYILLLNDWCNLSINVCIDTQSCIFAFVLEQLNLFYVVMSFVLDLKG